MTTDPMRLVDSAAYQELFIDELNWPPTRNSSLTSSTGTHPTRLPSPSTPTTGQLCKPTTSPPTMASASGSATSAPAPLSKPNSTASSPRTPLTDL